MENKINLVELLKDCPTGTELACMVFEDVYFDFIDEDRNMIQCYIQNANHKTSIAFNAYGHYSAINKSKCVIFPKDKTTWEGFVPPCKFNDGDVVVAENRDNVPSQLFLLKHVKYREDNNGYDGYCYFGWDFLDNRLFEEGTWGFNRLATEEEKQQLFDTINANGYRWNTETKTLEKLIKPKFKVGDRIKKNKDYISGIVTNISDDDTYKVEYQGRGVSYVSVAYQDEWELVSNKFDINTLVPFESRVLVRSTNDDIWRPAMYGFTDSDRYFVVGGIYWNQCIPYEGNEHLLGKTDNCDNFYKIWENI